MRLCNTALAVQPIFSAVCITTPRSRLLCFSPRLNYRDSFVAVVFVCAMAPSSCSAPPPFFFFCTDFDLFISLDGGTQARSMGLRQSRRNRTSVLPLKKGTRQRKPRSTLVGWQWCNINAESLPIQIDLKLEVHPAFKKIPNTSLLLVDQQNKMKRSPDN